MTTPVSDGGWSPVDRSRLARPGRPAAGAERAAGLVPLALLLVSLLVLAWSAIRPLPRAGVGADDIGPEVPRVPEIPGRDGDMARRSDVLARLGADNIFAHRRRAWPSMSEVADGAGTDSSGAGSPGNVVANPGHDVPPDIRPALDNILLKGVFDSRGTPGILISFIQGDEPGKHHTHRVGDQFVDKAFPTPAWKVVAIQPDFRRAVLSRGGRQVELRMFRNLPSLAQAAVQRPEPVVVTQSLDEIAAKLREAKIPEDQIARLLARMDTESAPAPVAAAPEAGGAGTPSSDGVDASAPTGLEEILRLMASGQPPGGMSGPASNNTPAQSGEKPKQTSPK